MENHQKPLYFDTFWVWDFRCTAGQGLFWDFLIILKSASRSGQKASKTIGYSDGCANVRIHGAKQGTAGGCLEAQDSVLSHGIPFLSPAWPKLLHLSYSFQFRVLPDFAFESRTEIESNETEFSPL